jgi:hypothetical protein
MAAPKASWFTNNTLVHHANPSLAAAPAENLRNDPNTILSFYDTVPKEEISLPQFEEWGMARLRSTCAVPRRFTCVLSAAVSEFDACSTNWDRATTKSE